jgi:hypothetical protein
MSDDGIETRTWAIRLWPFRLCVSLVRSTVGAHLAVHVHFLKLGLHFIISASD